ncbi:copper amine oxidase N-terminal domain-containing protein [Marinicrinis sediminis]|uniref:Copper amine oxidase N-terminal domain-containing protein n=1 Tax=Marinicrinis sediminis TaxID=1652465 RepID=A0ABW5REP9_9BACL
MTSRKALIILLLVVVCMHVVPAYASASKQNAPQVRITIDGQEVDANKIHITSSQTSMAPTRWFADFIGADTRYDAATKTIHITKDKQVLSVAIGKKEAKLNDKAVMLLQSPIMHNNLSYIPIKESLTLLGYHVSWDSGTKTVIITSGTSHDPEEINELMRSYISLINEKDIAGLRSLFIEESIMDQYFVFEGYKMLYFNVAVEIEEIDLLHMYQGEATVYVKSTYQGKEDSFFVDYWEETAYSLQFDTEKEQWLISDFHDLNSEFLQFEEDLVEADHVPAQVKNAIYSNHSKLQSAIKTENIYSYMQAYHPDTMLDRELLELETKAFFDTYDIQYDSENVILVDYQAESQNAIVFEMTTSQKKAGPEFTDHYVVTYYFYKMTETGEWKIFDEMMVEYGPLENE